MLYYNFIVGEKEKEKKDFIQIKEYFRKNK